MNGGILGGLILNYLGNSGIDVGSIIGNLENSGVDVSSIIENVAGGILMAIVAVLKNKLKK